MELPCYGTYTNFIRSLGYFRIINRLEQIYSNKQAHFLFSKTILKVGRARAATVDFAKYMYHRLGT